MITGAVLAVAGLVIGLAGAFRFNFGFMTFGWIAAIVGAAVFLSHVSEIW